MIRKPGSDKKASNSEPAYRFNSISMEHKFHAYGFENSCRRDFADMNINRTFAPLLTPVRVMGN